MQCMLCDATFYPKELNGLQAAECAGTTNQTSDVINLHASHSCECFGVCVRVWRHVCVGVGMCIHTCFIVTA